jgi:hypothetical protein
MSTVNLPLDVFKDYFNLIVMDYDKLNFTEKGIVLSLVKHYPNNFSDVMFVKYVNEKNNSSKNISFGGDRDYKITTLMLEPCNMKPLLEYDIASQMNQSQLESSIFPAK